MNENLEGTNILNFNKLNYVYDKIVESEEKVNEIKKAHVNDYLKYIHCNGCYKKCSLSNPGCGKGLNSSKLL